MGGKLTSAFTANGRARRWARRLARVLFVSTILVTQKQSQAGLRYGVQRGPEQ